MTNRTVLSAAALALTISAPAHALTFTGAQEFHRMCGGAFGAGFMNHNLCHGFVQQIASGMANAHQICLPAGLPERSTMIAVQDYMRERPDRLRYSARQVTAEALRRAYPCRRY